MKKGFTLVEIIAIVVILGVIGFFSVMGITNTIKSSNESKINDFNDILINAATIYLSENKDLFPNFNDKGDVTIIPASELISNGYIKSDINNPTDKEISDYYIKATIGDNNVINYEVSG